MPKDKILEGPVKPAEDRQTDVYPEETEGSRLAAEGRAECNNLSSAELDDLTDEAMAMIYGGAGARQAAGA